MQGLKYQKFYQKCVYHEIIISQKAFKYVQLVVQLSRQDVWSHLKVTQVYILVNI